jgi:hypothetical protein
MNPLNNLKKSGKYKSLHGTYAPVNMDKYRGKGLPQFKSRLELKLMCYLDKSSAVTEWCYEPFSIKYEDKSVLDANGQGVIRKYYVDFTATIKTGVVIKKVWIEVKSINEVLLSKKAKRNILENQTYIKNMSKWIVAKKLAKSHGYEFMIVTDRDLK